MVEKTTPRPKPYLRNKDFLAELIECQEAGKMSDKLGEMFMMLAERYSSKYQFAGYSYRDELVNNAIVACCNAWNKFDPGKSSNPFAFFTVVTNNAFIQILNKEKRQQMIRDELLIEEDLDPSFNFQERDSID